MLLVLKNIMINTQNNNRTIENGLFIITTVNLQSFKLSEDDRVNISSRIPKMKFKQLEMWLYSKSTNNFYVFIPKTSEKSFLHLLKIDRPLLKNLFEVKNPDISNFTNSNRIEMYQYEGAQYRRYESNQNNFDILELIDNENELVSPYLVHYLLILICILISFDLSFKYRILKI